MKKILSTILTIALISASITVSVMADSTEVGILDYTGSEYDIVDSTVTFDDGTQTGVDGTPAKQVGSTEERVFTTSLNTTQEFFMSFDFRFDSESALIQIPNYKSSGAVNKVGPRIKYSGGNLVTESGSSSTQSLGAFTVGEWYTGEIEGRTGMGAQYTTFRLYSYSDGVKTLVQETSNFNMRNLSSEGRSFGGMTINDVTVDNITLIAQKPDLITITSDTETVDAGQILTFDYTMSRLGVETTKYTVEWNLYDETGNSEITDGTVSISSNGVLSADISSPSQTVLVKASLVLGDKTLTGEKIVSVNSVNTDSEKFDTITLNGADSMKAGTSVTLTTEATKQGTAVETTPEDVVWSIYNCENLQPNNNKNITVRDGVVTVADGVLPQDIYVRATSVSGKVYGAKKISISVSDSQMEEIIYSSACEEAYDGTTITTSIDGSSAYELTSSIVPWSVVNYGEYLLTKLDIKFTTNGAGIGLKRRDGQKTNTEITYSNGTIKTYGETLMTGADTESWYHLEVVYSSDSMSAACNIYTYNADGTLGAPVTCNDINMRNESTYGRLDIYTGAIIDNVVISKVIPNAVEIKPSTNNMFVGNTNQVSLTAERNGLKIKSVSGVQWSVEDSMGLTIVDGSVTVDENGLVTVDPLTKAQEIKVVAKCGDVVAKAPINIQSGDVFSVTDIGVNEEKTRIEKLYFDKNFYYNDDVIFIITITNNSDGTLEDVALRDGYGDEFVIGGNSISIGLDLPIDFDPEAYTIKAFVWTGL